MEVTERTGRGAEVVKEGTWIGNCNSSAIYPSQR